MSTKNLSRSVIEGGQHASNKIERRVSARSLRADTRAYLSAARRDPEATERMAYPRAERVYRHFADKLSPAYRFLDSRVGKSWNKTRALLADRFDTRTTPGRHVVHDHILREVATSKAAVETSWFRTHYYVDARGILRKAPPLPSRQKGRPVFDREAVLSWLDGRQVGRVGSRLFWFVAARDAKTIHVEADPRRTAVRYRGMHPDDPKPAFRQSRPLAKADVEFFASLDERVQEAILRCAPTSTPKDGVR